MNSNEKGINRFTLKSSLYIYATGLFTNLLLPTFLESIGFDLRLVTMLGNIILLPFVIAYTRCYIDSNDKMGRKFIQTFMVAAISFGLLTYFWLYLDILI